MLFVRALCEFKSALCELKSALLLKGRASLFFHYPVFEMHCNSCVLFFNVWPGEQESETLKTPTNFDRFRNQS